MKSGIDVGDGTGVSILRNVVKVVQVLAGLGFMEAS